MNSRNPLLNPIVLIGAFLALFWTAGLLLTFERTPREDEAYILPSFKGARNVEIDAVAIERQAKGKDAAEFRFVRKGEDWTLQQGNQSIKVEGFRIRDLVREVKELKRDADVKVAGSPASLGLQPPQATVVLSGKLKRKGDGDADGPAREWKLLLGNETEDKKFVYASTSDRPGVVFAVPRNTLSAVYFKNANDLRSKRLFDFNEASVQSFTIKDGTNELEAKKSPDGTWQLVKPNLGYADVEGPPIPKDAPPKGDAAKTTEGGIKNLLAAIAAVRVDSEDDFVAPAADTLERNDLVSGKEKIRIQVFSGESTKPSEETLIVGRRDQDYYYARLATDEGAFKLPAKMLAPILETLQSPAKLRNLDLSPISLKDADAITLTVGKEEARFLLSAEPRGWTVELSASSATAANNKRVEVLLETLQGRRSILGFNDAVGADAAKVDAELGFDQPQASAAVYLQSLESRKDPKLKKDAKAAVTLHFGKTDGDQVWVRRTMADGATTRFSVAKSILEKLAPREGMIGYLETVLPKVSPQNVTKIELNRGGKNLTLTKIDNRWFLKDPAGDIVADAEKAEDVVRTLSTMPIRRWVKKTGAKDEIAAYGLGTPDLTATLTLKKNQLTSEAIGSALGQLGGIMTDPSLAALGAAWSNLQLGDRVIIKFGKEATDSEDAGSRYVEHSQTDRLSLVPGAVANLLRTVDLRDRSTILASQVHLMTAFVGAPAATPTAGFLTANPLVTGQLGRGDASQVKTLKVTVRTPIELRTFAFTRDGKGWTDQSGLKEFQIDDEHVNQIADLVARQEISRVISLVGSAKEDQKLTSKDASVVIEAVMSDLRPVSMTIGANFEGVGYFTQISSWPGAVFFVSPDRVLPILRGAAFFAKERVAAH